MEIQLKMDQSSKKECFSERKEIKYSETDLKCGIRIKKVLSDITDILLEIKNSQDYKFSYIIIHSNQPDFLKFLNENKRDTDLAYILSDKEGIYCLVCQETNVEGAYRFSERIMKMIDLEDESVDVYSSVLFIDRNYVGSKGRNFILIKLMELFSESRNQDKKWRKGQITYKTI